MWKTAHLEARILAADSLELISLLYQRAIDEVRDARRHLASGEIAKRGRAICKAVAILGELGGSLDHKAGGAISANLDRLYRYIMVRLTEANMQKQDAPLAEVESLLVTLAQAWKQIERERAGHAAVETLPAPAAWQDSGENGSAHTWDA